MKIIMKQRKQIFCVVFSQFAAELISHDPKKWV